MKTNSPLETSKPVLAAFQENSAPSTPMFVWSFFMNVPDAESRRAPLSKASLNIGSEVTPAKGAEDRQSANSRTPYSFIDKMADFSPFRTTCQKRADHSPISPGFWKKANSSLKKTKQASENHFHGLFHQSNEKEGIYQPRAEFSDRSLERTLFHNDLLLFPDLDRNICEPFHNDRNFARGNNFSFEEPLQIERAFQRPTPQFQPKEVAIVKTKDKEKEKESEEGCNCRNTKCLKLYCECLRKGSMCNANCNCVGCENHGCSEIRKERVRHIEKKNPNAFRPVIKELNAKEASKVHSKGCNCRRSNCLKNYCECHQFGARCTDACKCTECKNTPEFSTEAAKLKTGILGGPKNEAADDLLMGSFIESLDL
jgi:hypothetical protein